MKYRINLYNTTIGTAPNWNSTNIITVGVIIAELTDWDTGLPSGVRLSIVDAAPTAKSSSGGLVSGSPHGIEQSVWANYFQYSSGTTSKFLLDEIIPGGSDWEIGKKFFVRFAALNSNAGTLSLTASTGENGSYASIAQGVPIANPPIPTVFEATVVDDGAGRARILLSVSSTAALRNLQFIEVFDAKINSISDGVVRIGEAQTWSITGFVPVSATIDGIALTGVNSSGFVMPDYDDAAIPNYGYRQVTATDGTITASYWVYVEPKTGYHYTRIEGVSITTDGYLQTHYPPLAVGWTVTMLDGNQLVPAVAFNTVGTDGEIITDYEGIQQIYVWKSTDKSIVMLDLDTSGSVPVVTVALTGQKIKASKIGAAKITATNL